MGSIIYREIGRKVGIVTTIRETCNWMCCYLNEGERGVDIIHQVSITGNVRAYGWMRGELSK